MWCGSRNSRKKASTRLIRGLHLTYGAAGQSTEILPFKSADPRGDSVSLRSGWRSQTTFSAKISEI